MILYDNIPKHAPTQPNQIKYLECFKQTNFIYK